MEKKNYDVQGKTNDPGSDSLAGKASPSIAPTMTTHHPDNYENTIRQLRYCNHQNERKKKLYELIQSQWRDRKSPPNHSQTHPELRRQSGN